MNTGGINAAPTAEIVGAMPFIARLSPLNQALNASGFIVFSISWEPQRLRRLFEITGSAGGSPAPFKFGN
ncbi:MAG: hypothetical protein DKT66_07825 [Candidatus Melainabacteria bacterium]|nr:MAG: hypothetical protein DKT66_07825 [Candidatus Melainabacteria bacterium]